MTKKKKKKLVGIAAVAVLAVSTVGCTSQDSAQTRTQEQTETAFKQQEKAVPYPAEELNHSLERQNLRRRLLAEENPNKIGYVYVMSFGKFIGYYVVKGKVSSNQSEMTTDQLIVRKCFNGGCGEFVVDAPGDNGSYGENEDGIFFFTTSGALITTNLDYVYSDQPMQIEVPNLLNDKE